MMMLADKVDGAKYSRTGVSGLHENLVGHGDGHAVIHMSDGTNYAPWAALTGPQGPPHYVGEVRNPQLAEAINNALAGTPTNCNNVVALSLTVSDPPTLSELQAVVDKMNELINVLRR